MAKRKTFGQLSESAQRRAVLAGERYNLTRKQVRDRYNRGSFNPFARTRPELRVPLEFRDYENPATGAINWKEAALANMRLHLSDYFKYNDPDVVSNVYDYASTTVTHDYEELDRQLVEFVDKASLKALQAMAVASEDELVSIAHIQNPTERISNLPRGLKIVDIGAIRNGEWLNIFWYH